jgi:hypothetical protein
MTAKNMKAKTNVMVKKMSPKHLFQIPFSKNQIKKYKHISDVFTMDCLFHTLTALGLRHSAISYHDSMKMYEIKGDGVRVDYAGDYISSLFDTKIKMVEHRPYKLSDIISKLENGYATLVCGAYDHGCKNLSGHFFIIYKVNNEIYIYNPQSRYKNLNPIAESSHIKNLKCIIAYYNTNRVAAQLNKDRLNNAIPF